MKRERHSKKQRAQKSLREEDRSLAGCALRAAGACRCQAAPDPALPPGCAGGAAATATQGPQARSRSARSGSTRRAATSSCRSGPSSASCIRSATYACFSRAAPLPRRKQGDRLGHVPPGPPLPEPGDARAPRGHGGLHGPPAKTDHDKRKAPTEQPAFQYLGVGADTLRRVGFPCYLGEVLVALLCELLVQKHVVQQKSKIPKTFLESSKIPT